ncbi:hypothetical protein [Rhodocyclus tenuis]|uniref:Uncharacterized protein n=1 Tax=Rhodocyclus tenuis TaxID=1066 RepID=A0A840G7W4_RHOTE|nr:hypothetical protein [Rhodocyclus tenuis]MBB4247975.1 hypothetical protein [Rhodocyclus tenuis]
MTDTPRFNAFLAEAIPAAWSEFAFFHRKKNPEKEQRAEIARLWREKAVLAESGDSSRGSWIACPSGTPAERLAGHGFLPCAMEAVPADVLLNFVLAMRIGTPAGEPTYRMPSATYWEAKRNPKSHTMVCFKPEFVEYAGMQVLKISATGFKAVRPGFPSKKASAVFSETSPGTYENVGYRIPEAGDVVKEAPIRSARPRLPWTPMRPEGSGPMDSKVGFASWLVGGINASGMASLEAAHIESRPVKELVGRRGMTSHLDKSKLVEAIFSSLASREIHLYDRRTEADNLGAWELFSSAMTKACDGFGLAVTDRGNSPYVETAAQIFVAIDREEAFDEDGAADTKPAAVASFPRPVQCFTGEIVTRPSEDAGSEISPAAVLVMLANSVLKDEVAARRLIMPREWVATDVMGSVADYVFCDGFADGEDKTFAGIQIARDGSIEFLEEPTEGRLYESVIARKLTPVFRRLASDPPRKEFVGAVEILTTPVRALPLFTKKGMSGHFTGVRVVERLGAYYSSGSDNPKSLKVEKSLVLRQVERVGGTFSGDLEMMAGFCVDPTVRLNAATVWPAPYKLLREYFFTKP